MKRKHPEILFLRLSMYADSARHIPYICRRRHADSGSCQSVPVTLTRPPRHREVGLGRPRFSDAALASELNSRSCEISAIHDPSFFFSTRSEVGSSVGCRASDFFHREITWPDSVDELLRIHLCCPSPISIGDIKKWKFSPCPPRMPAVSGDVPHKQLPRPASSVWEGRSQCSDPTTRGVPAAD